MKTLFMGEAKHTAGGTAPPAEITPWSADFLKASGTGAVGENSDLAGGDTGA